MALIDNTGKEIKKPGYNNVKIGSAVGLIAPWITFFAYYLIFHRHISMREFFNYLKEGQIFVSTLSLCVITDLLVFYLFIWTDRDKSARGVVFAVILYAFYVAIMKTI